MFYRLLCEKQAREALLFQTYAVYTAITRFIFLAQNFLQQNPVSAKGRFLVSQFAGLTSKKHPI